MTPRPWSVRAAGSIAGTLIALGFDAIDLAAVVADVHRHVDPALASMAVRFVGEPVLVIEPANQLSAMVVDSALGTEHTAHILTASFLGTSQPA